MSITPSALLSSPLLSHLSSSFLSSTPSYLSIRKNLTEYTTSNESLYYKRRSSQEVNGSVQSSESFTADPSISTENTNNIFNSHTASDRHAVNAVLDAEETTSVHMRRRDNIHSTTLPVEAKIWNDKTVNHSRPQLQHRAKRSRNFHDAESSENYNYSENDMSSEDNIAPNNIFLGHHSHLRHSPLLVKSRRTNRSPEQKHLKRNIEEVSSDIKYRKGQKNFSPKLYSKETPFGTSQSIKSSSFEFNRPVEIRRKHISNSRRVQHQQHNTKETFPFKASQFSHQWIENNPRVINAPISEHPRKFLHDKQAYKVPYRDDLSRVSANVPKNKFHSPSFNFQSSKQHTTNTLKTLSSPRHHNSAVAHNFSWKDRSPAYTRRKEYSSPTLMSYQTSSARKSGHILKALNFPLAAPSDIQFTRHLVAPPGHTIHLWIPKVEHIAEPNQLCDGVSILRPYQILSCKRMTRSFIAVNEYFRLMVHYHVCYFLLVC